MTTAAVKRRPSHINLSGVNSLPAETRLGPRTPKSISKSRRSSIVAENTGTFPPPQPTTSVSGSSRSSSRRNSLANNFFSPQQLTPSLLSENAVSGYFQAPKTTETMDVDHCEALPTRPRSSSTDSILSTPSAGLPGPLAGRTTGTAVNVTAAAFAAAQGTAAALAAAGPNPAPNVEGHMSYKIKTTKSSKKLDHFFGEQAFHDICIKEIRKEGLKAMLQSKTPLCYFLYHLLEEYSSENLFFFIEIEQYESFRYVSLVQQLATAQHIYNTYLSRASHFEVNLDDKVRRQVTAAIQEKRVEGCFTSAKRAVYSLLESSFMRFVTTDTFQRMVMNCGELTTHYDTDTRNMAIETLMQYIDRQHDMIYTNPHTDAPVFASINQTSRKRHELIKFMIFEFCRTLMDVDPYRIQQRRAQQQQQHQQQRLNSPSMKSSISSSPSVKSPKLLPKDIFDFFGKKKH